MTLSSSVSRLLVSGHAVLVCGHALRSCSQLVVPLSCSQPYEEPRVAQAKGCWERWMPARWHPVHKKMFRRHLEIVGLVYSVIGDEACTSSTCETMKSVVKAAMLRGKLQEYKETKCLKTRWHHHHRFSNGVNFHTSASTRSLGIRMPVQRNWVSTCLSI